MKKILVIFPVLVCMMAHAQFETDWSRGWRFTVGPRFDFDSSGHLAVKAKAVRPPSSVISGNRSQAQLDGDAISLGGGRVDFPNGAYVDPDDAAGVYGETWNWYVPASQLNDGRMTFANPYTEQSTTYEPFGGSSRDDHWDTGVGFGLERSVWRYGDLGVDVGLDFSFHLKDGWYRGAAGGYTRSDTTYSGSYNTEVDMGNIDVLNDPWTQNGDGSFGAGSFAGPGPVISLGEMSLSHYWGAESADTSRTSQGPFSIRGDLQTYEFQLALKPYYELTAWFKLRGTFGLGLDYRNFDVKVDGLGNSSAHDWDCYMISGLGGMFHWKNFCLGADFLRKLFADDLDVNTRYVNGSIRNANWMLRVYVGYEF